MNDPTQEQIKELWERYGFEDIQYYDHRGKLIKGAIHHVSPDQSWGQSSYPPIDLNNLFKYAVDEAVNVIQNENEQLYSDEALWYLFDIWVQLMKWDYTEIALFWALWQVKDKEEETAQIR